MPDWSALFTGPDWTRILLGGLLFWLPGLTWAWALARELGPLRWLLLSLVLAFTLEPAVMLFLAMFFSVPIRLGTTATLSVAVALAGLGVGLRGPVRAAFRA